VALDTTQKKNKKRSKKKQNKYNPKKNKKKIQPKKKQKKQKNKETSLHGDQGGLAVKRREFFRSNF
jgi:hypothetical protein